MWESLASNRQMGKTASRFFFPVNTSGKVLLCQFLGKCPSWAHEEVGISSKTRSQAGEVEKRLKRKWQKAAHPVTSCVPSHVALSPFALLLIILPAFGMPFSPSLARWLQICKVSNPDALWGSLRSEFPGHLVLALRQWPHFSLERNLCARLKQPSTNL